MMPPSVFLAGTVTCPTRTSTSGEVSYEMGATVKNGALFPLYDAPEDVWLAWRPKIPL